MWILGLYFLRRLKLVLTNNYNYILQFYLNMLHNNITKLKEHDVDIHA